MKKTITTAAIAFSLFILPYQVNAKLNLQEAQESKQEKQEKQPSIIRRSEAQLRLNATNKAVPEYPIDAKSRNLEGDVVTEITISEEGNVIYAKALSGDQVFIQPTLDAVKKWTFQPTKINGKGARVTGVLTFRFKLENPIASSDNLKSNADVPLQTIVRRSEGVLRANVINKPSPVYPEKAKEEKIEGDVVVEITINEEGNVISTRTVTGNSMLAEAAETAAKDWIFKPTTLNDKPIKVTGAITFRFLLEEKDK
jgi:TonB family protein